MISGKFASRPLPPSNLINEAVKLYQQQTNSKDPYKDFYNLPIQLVGGSTGYMVRVIINYLFNAAHSARAHIKVRYLGSAPYFWVRVSALSSTHFAVAPPSSVSTV